MDTGFASFILILSAILVVSILLCYCSFQARGWKKFAEEKLAMERLQVKRLHQAEYTYDEPNVGQCEVTRELVLAFRYLGIGCDAIYHSEDMRISDEAIEGGRIRIITVRGTQDLEDILLDIDIKGISPVHDLVNEERDLSTRLISFFGKDSEPEDLGANWIRY